MKHKNKEIRELDKIWKEIDEEKGETYTAEEFFEKLGSNFE